MNNGKAILAIGIVFFFAAFALMVADRVDQGASHARLSPDALAALEAVEMQNETWAPLVLMGMMGILALGLMLGVALIVHIVNK